jgi:uncharacterized protein YgiM (DUF1202 family)
MMALKNYGAYVAGLVLALGMGSVQAQSDALITKRAAELREGPTDGARSLASLPSQTSVTRLALRQGPWLQVKTAAGQTGWVHMFDIGTLPSQSAAASTAAGALRGLTNFFNRGSAQGASNTAATSTVGIRGLGAEDLANAQPNQQAVLQMEGLRADAAQATRFASEAAWVVRAVEPLPEPAPPAAPITPNKKESF